MLKTKPQLVPPGIATRKKRPLQPHHLPCSGIIGQGKETRKNGKEAGEGKKKYAFYRRKGTEDFFPENGGP